MFSPQGRQKLARFNRAEFTGLLTDVLVDAMRRQNMANLRPLDAPLPGHQSLQSLPYANNSMFEQGGHDPNLSDDEPIYDACFRFFGGFSILFRILFCKIGSMSHLTNVPKQ